VLERSRSRGQTLRMREMSGIPAMTGICWSQEGGLSPSRLHVFAPGGGGPTTVRGGIGFYLRAKTPTRSLYRQLNISQPAIPLHIQNDSISRSHPVK
jgi:hypothetical protein